MIADEYVIIGKIGSTYGVKGWVKVFSYTADITDILEFNPLYIESLAGWDVIKLQDGRAHGKVMVLKIPGYESPEKARVLTGKHFAVKKSQLPKLEENKYYWRDLEGLTVINQKGEILGTVSYLMETGSNDVLVVKGEKEHAIPYLPGSVIIKIDLDKKEMHVDWEL